MHFVFHWNADADHVARVTPELQACFADYESVEVMPHYHVVRVTGHGHQEGIQKRLKETAGRLADCNITYLITPLIIGGQYQGRLFDNDLAERVNELTHEEFA